MATADTRAIALVLALKEELPVFQSALTDKLKTVATAKNPIGAMRDKIVRTELLDPSFDIKASIEALLQTKRIETMLALVNSIDTKKNLDDPTKQKVYEANTLVEIYKTSFKNFQVATTDPRRGRVLQSYYYLIKTIKAVEAINTAADPNIPAIDTTAFESFKRFIQLKAYADILAADLQQMKTILEERKARDPKKDSRIPGMASGFKPSSIAKIQTATDLLEQTDEKSMQGMIQIAAKLQRMQYPAVDLVFLATGLAKYMKDYLTTGPLHTDIFKKFQPDNKLYPIPLFILQLPILGYKPDGSNLTGTRPGAPLSNGIQGEAPATDGSMKLRMTSDKDLDPGTPGSNPVSTPGQTGSTADLSSANEQDLALAKQPKGRTIRSYGLEDIPVPPIGTPIPDDWKNIDPYRVFANQYNLINASQTKGDAWAKKILNEIINNDCFSDPNIMYSTTCPNLRDYLYEMSMASLTGDFTMEPPEIPTNETYGIVGIKLVIGLDALETSLDPAPELQGLTGFSRDITKKFLAIRKKVRALLNPPGVGGSGGSGGSSGGLSGSSGGLGSAGAPDFAATMTKSIGDIRSALRGLGVVT